MSNEWCLLDGVFGPHDRPSPPDTVVRTTPQNFTEGQKTQVKVNLNIEEGGGALVLASPFDAAWPLVVGDYGLQGDSTMFAGAARNVALRVFQAANVYETNQDVTDLPGAVDRLDNDTDPLDAPICVLINQTTPAENGAWPAVTGGGQALSGVFVITGGAHSGEFWACAANGVTMQLSGNYNDLTGTPAFGTAAYINYPEDGDAAIDEVVLGNDSRLGGGLATGNAVAGATASRILTTDASSQLANSTAWQFGNLAFGGMSSRQCLRGVSGADGFIASVPGGLFLGREDAGVGAFIGQYSINGVVIPVGCCLGFGSNSSDYRTSVANLELHDASIIKGAALKMRTSTVAGLASLDAATWIDTQVICTDETGGRVPVFSDGTNWRRVTDRAIAS